MLTLEDAKAYLRIDSDITSEDAFLSSCVVAAEAYLTHAIDGYQEKLQDEAFAARARQLSLMMVAEMFTNRDATGDTRKDWPFAIRAFMVQLQYAV